MARPHLRDWPGHVLEILRSAGLRSRVHFQCSAKQNMTEMHITIQQWSSWREVRFRSGKLVKPSACSPNRDIIQESINNFLMFYCYWGQKSKWKDFWKQGMSLLLKDVFGWGEWSGPILGDVWLRSGGAERSIRANILQRFRMSPLHKIYWTSWLPYHSVFLCLPYRSSLSLYVASSANALAPAGIRPVCHPN
jgi:hypothetical protein